VRGADFSSFFLDRKIWLAVLDIELRTGRCAADSLSWHHMCRLDPVMRKPLVVIDVPSLSFCPIGTEVGGAQPGGCHGNSEIV